MSHSKVITPKHYLFALGLHNLTAQKQTVVVANKFGHFISYDLCCEAETSLSEASIAKSKKMIILSIRPEGSQIALTVFWEDNLDVTVEKTLGGGVVNATHLMAFQEQAHHNKQDLHVPVQRVRKRKLSTWEEDEHVGFTLDIVTEPPRKDISHQLNYDSTYFHQLQFIWLYLCKWNHFDLAVSNFTWWRLFERKTVVQKVQKTFETYLRPMTIKVTEFTTTSKYMT